MEHWDKVIGWGRYRPHGGEVGAKPADTEDSADIHGSHDAEVLPADVGPAVPAPVEKPQTLDLSSAAGQAHLNRMLRDATGWEIEQINANAGTGFFRMVVSRQDGPHREGVGKVVVTLLRGGHSGKVTEMREIHTIRSGFSGHWWDFENSPVLGRRTHDGIRPALSDVAQYIDDNKAQGRIGSSQALFKQIGVA
jgi:hypothetical protein